MVTLGEAHAATSVFLHCLLAKDLLRDLLTCWWPLLLLPLLLMNEKGDFGAAVRQGQAVPFVPPGLLLVRPFLTPHQLLKKLVQAL